MKPTIYSPTMHRRPPRAMRILVAAIALAGLGLAVSGVVEARSTSKARVVYGAAQNLGDGSARVYVTLDENKRPASIGVSISESAMNSLPMKPIAPSPSAATLMLSLPKDVKVEGYDHVMLDWNPAGHEPEQVYTHPHFDFHFYSISEKEQMAIMPNAPDFEKRAARVPDAQFAPAGYVSAHVLMKATPAAATIPMMGLHWIDGSANELHGHMFTTTFLWGSYDGRFIFLEPMITKAYIESAKSAPNNTIVTPLNAPAKYQSAAFYPNRYTIRWDGAAREYHISLDGLEKQK